MGELSPKKTQGSRGTGNTSNNLWTVKHIDQYKIISI